MRQHGSSQPHAGGGHHRAVGAVALIAACALAAFGLAACGGGDDDDGTATLTQTVAPQATNDVPKGPVTATAEELIPDLTTEGYVLADEFSQPLGGGGQDNYRKAYQKPNGGIALVDVTVFATEDDAKQAYAQVSEAWRNPPPGVFGGIEKFEETPSPDAGDERRSYVSANADSTGNRAWTDVYRDANVVIVVQTLDRGDTDQLPLRKSFVDGVLDQID